MLLRWVAWFCILSAFGCRCGASSDGPDGRLRSITGCKVPGGAVDIGDEIGGTAEQLIYWAKVVIAKDDLPEFLASCGTDLDDAKAGFALDLAESAPSQWRLPDPSLVASFEAPNATVLVLERDTDFAVYVHHTGR